MALGTPADRGTASRNYSSNSDISVASFTPSADDFLLAFVDIGNGASLEPTMSGQDSGISWTRIGSVETTSNHHSILYGAAVGGSPSAGVVTASYATTVSMTLQLTSISGVDVSSNIANAILQSDQGNVYGTLLTLALTTPSNLTVGGWSVFGNTVIAEGTVINSVGSPHTILDYDATGDATPSASVASGNTNFIGVAVELKEAVAGGGPVYQSIKHKYLRTLLTR